MSSPVPNAGLERERLTSLINSMADGVIALDELGSVVIYNGAALNILDLNSSMSGKPLSRLMKLVDKNKRPMDVGQLIRAAKSAISFRDYRLEYSDGSSINVYLSVAPVHLGFGKTGARGYVVLLRDITREKSLEEERDEFISVVSHELRNPVAIAEGNLSNAKLIVEKSGDLSQVKDTLRQAYDQIMFLSGLINDLATLSRAERGKLNVEIEDINTHELLNDLAQNYQPQAKAKGLQLYTQLDPNLEVLKSSKLYVREVLQNFITNAIKYTESGSVSVSAKPKDNGVLVEVKDTGIGISKSDQNKVFEKFFRSEDARTRKNSGTGLGLYVTMKLAGLIGAQISMQSELNKGSVFSIYIPNLQPKPNDK